MKSGANYFEAILNATTESIFLVDVQGFVLTVNETAAQRLNQTRTDMVGKYVYDYFPPDTAEMRRRNLEEVVSSGLSMHTEDTRAGRFFSLTYYPVKDESGKVNAVTVYAAEITARKQAEALRQEALDRFQQLTQLVPGVVFQYRLRPDGSTCMPYVSDAFQNMFHLTSDAVREDATKALMRAHPDDVQNLMDSIQASAQTMAPWQHEYRLKFDDGTVRWVYGNSQPQREADESILWHGVITDITESKQAEVALLESEERWKFAIEGSGDGLWDWNVQTGKAYYSPRYKEMLGYVDADFGTTPDEWSKRIHPDDAPGVFAALQPYMDGKAGSVAVEFRMLCKDGGWQWTLGRGMVVSRDADGKPIRLIGTNTDITERKVAADKIERLAFYDSLTDLPNRRLLLDRLEHALTNCGRHNRYGALMLLDIDDFKTLNDTLGHDVGDQFLVEVARRLHTSVRESDTVARHGGDEFVVILEDLNEDTLAAMQAESVAVKILRAVSQPYLLDLSTPVGIQNTRSYHCTSSIGITLFSDNSISVDELLRRADTAMYKAKAEGRNSLRFFDPEMQALVTARAALDNDLRMAVRESQFLLYYQPQVDGEGCITGAEALVRWQHPEYGMVSPADFIPQAEVTGLIVPIGNWVLKTACAQLAAWSKHPETSHLTLAVNVSARQFRHPDFVDQVLSVVESTGASAKKLKLELTESLLLEDAEDIIAKMNTLKAKGIGFALDDFGTGYSSLSYLKRLPLDQLKIDRSFVRDVLTDPNDAAIAKTIVALAQSLGLGVIAEGVETEAQREFLASNGCTTYQGYLFGRPMPIEEFLIGQE